MSPEPKEKKSPQSGEDIENIISGLLLERDNIKIKSSLSKIIHASELVEQSVRKTQIIGGDADLNDQDSPPAIVIEKEGERISKIVVKCPCGRHAELFCEYNDDANQETE